MKIRELHVDDALGKKVRLANFSMKRLGSLVALIGKNGSGKTRVLNLLSDYISSSNIQKGHIENLGSEYSLARENSSLSIDKNEGAFITELKKRVVFLESEKLMDLDLSKKDDLVDFKTLLDFPNKIETIDNVQLTKSAIFYFNSLSSRLLFDVWNASRKKQNSDSIPNKQLFDLLVAIVKSMMGLELNYDADPDETSKNIRAVMTLDGQPFNYDWLSPGQKILFSYCIYFFLLESNPDFNLRNSIVVIDEPEKHLHPEAQIQLVNGIHSMVQNEGQLWIATHSVHILSMLRPDEIFWVESSNVRSPSSFTPSKALEALMGYEFNYVDLIKLLLSTSDWAFAKFTSDCLLNPSVISSTTPSDPQFKQFLEFLRSHRFENVLDFGAGMGRLEKALTESKAELRFTLDAYEPNQEFIPELKNLKIVSKVFNSLDQLGSEKYGLVVMSNVLHEIHVGDWNSTFKSIKRTLRSDGYLMILEDLILPQGEAPNEIGFLVLNHEELRKLFNLQAAPLLIFSKEEKYRDRIMCAVFKSSDISSWTDYDVLPSIEMLKGRCLTNIKAMRTEQNEFTGRVLAFYNQQYINCELAIQYLKDNRWR